MADAVLRLPVRHGEADGAGMVGKVAYFFDTFANALAALDDADLSVATGVRSPKAVNALTNAVGAAITGKGVTVNNNGMVLCSLDNASDHYMVIPKSGHAHDPLFIPAEALA